MFNPDFSGVCVSPHLIFCIVFCRSLFVLLLFSLGHFIVRPSWIYGFCLHLWYLQTVLTIHEAFICIPSEQRLVYLLRHAQLAHTIFKRATSSNGETKHYLYTMTSPWIATEQISNSYDTDCKTTIHN